MKDRILEAIRIAKDKICEDIDVYRFLDQFMPHTHTEDKETSKKILEVKLADMEEMEAFIVDHDLEFKKN